MTAKKTPAITLADAAPVKGRKLLLVDKPDSTQTYFRLGNVGIGRTNPDRVLVEIVNTLFGGRFTSMINTALRIKSGLTYGAGSSFAQWKAKGPFAINSYTRNDATEQALTFNKAVGFDAAILTKVDADAKGGSSLSVSFLTGKPVIYIGVGQGYDDLQPFYAGWFPEKLLGDS